MKIYPFREGDTSSTFRNIINQVTNEIQLLDNEYVLKASPAELEDHFVEKVIVAPIVLHVDQLYIENQEGTEIDVSRDFRRNAFPGEMLRVHGTRLDIAIPYEGDPVLWRVRPSTYSLGGYPEIYVRDDVIVIDLSFPDDSADSEKLKPRIDSYVRSLSEAIQNQKRDVDNHNSSAPQAVKDVIQRKRNLARSTVGAVSALGIPIKRRNEPMTFTVPIKRRTMPSVRPAVATEPYKPEPALQTEEYQYILKVVRSMSLVMERSPNTFSSLDEESIRNHFLIQLNGHYEGGALGEVFNASGKTDILIRVENRNVFIAECKFWRGVKGFSEAIDQLLGYLAWRDTKSALIVFNKNRDSSSVGHNMHITMKSRPEHKRTLVHESRGNSSYLFVKKSDPGREIIITTLLFDVPDVVQK